MRVIAGQLGGRRLLAGGRAHRGLRPTSERVREAVFSILGDLEGMRVLDLFAGTGALGIEAISRGAAAATFVDRDVGLVEANVGELGIAEACEVVRRDVRSFLRDDRGAYDLVFCDPPYKLARRLGDELDKLLPPRLAEGSRVILESDSGEGLALSLPLLDERRYGATAIRIHGVEVDG